MLFSFLRSTWTSALVPIGLDKDGDEVWQDWSIPHVTEAADEIRWLGLPSDPYVPDRIAEFILVFLDRIEKTRTGTRSIGGRLRHTSRVGVQGFWNRSSSSHIRV